MNLIITVSWKYTFYRSFLIFSNFFEKWNNFDIKAFFKVHIINSFRECYWLTKSVDYIFKISFYNLKFYLAKVQFFLFFLNGQIIKIIFNILSCQIPMDAICCEFWFWSFHLKFNYILKLKFLESGISS